MSATRLRRKLECPGCWGTFDPRDMLWISEHQDLRGDVRLEDEQVRFLPTRFTPDGRALDMKDLPCSLVACPHCHLQIPRSLLEFRPFPLSLIGAPSSGKSFYLGALSWTLRGFLPQHLDLSFDDADASANLIINGYEQSLFMSEGNGHPRFLGEIIAKTLEQGGLYRRVRYADHETRYSMPFSFRMAPRESHRRFTQRSEAGRTVILYDCAGEHFLPGQQSDSASITRNIAGSAAMFYIFDPTQDVQFRRATRQQGIQIAETRSRNQIQVLQEAATRLRRFSNLAASARTRQPLIVVLTKCDTWLDRRTPPEQELLHRNADGQAVLDIERIRAMSQTLRQTLVNILPQLVHAAENLSETVFFIPVSSVGWECVAVPDEQRSDTAPYAINPESIVPFWSTVPFLTALHVTGTGLV